MTNIQVLLLIAVFLFLTVGSFIWFIATWDATKEEPVSLMMPRASQTEVAV